MVDDLQLFIDLVEELIEDEKNNPVVDPIPIEELYDRIDIRLSDEPALEKDFVNTLRKLVLNTPRTATNLFFNQLFGGRNSKAVLGDLLAVMLNNSMYTYKVGGPQIGVEKEILRQSAAKIGYNVPAAEGTLAPGGSMTNFMGMIMARDAKDPEARHDGISKKLIVYTSTESHYSTPKNAAFAGIGRNNIRFIKTDHSGRMSMEDLKNAVESDIKSGLTPCMVVATAGTTVLCAYDPMDGIAEICAEYDMWFHVDGAYGGAAIFSDKYRYLLKGSEHADSFTYNAHKLCSTPLSCSIILVKDKQRMYDSFSNDASYLYQTGDDEYNPGKISLQCGRRNDALKFWTLWKSIGTSGLEKLVDHQFELAERARNYVEDHPEYTLYNTDDSVAVCFNYKDIDPKVLCTKLYQESELMVGYGKFEDQEFVRLVMVNAGNSHQDIENFFKVLEKFANQHF